MDNDIQIDVQETSEKLKIRPQIYVKLVISFTNSLDSKLKILNDALAANDRDQMRMILHEIKGTAGNLRLHNILGPEAILHTAVKAGESQAVLYKHLDILKAEIIKLQKCVHVLTAEYE